MKKIIEAAIQELKNQGYSAEKTSGGFIRVYLDPSEMRFGICPIRTGANVVEVHHTRVFEFINEKS